MKVDTDTASWLDFFSKPHGWGVGNESDEMRDGSSIPYDIGGAII